MESDKPEEFDEEGEAELARNASGDLDAVHLELRRDVERVDKVAADDQRVGRRVL